MKDIVTKSENGKSLSNNDRVELVRIAGNFLIIKNGSSPSVDARKSIALILHEQYPGLDQGTWYKRLTQRIKNCRRKKSPSGDHENDNQDPIRINDEEGGTLETDSLEGQEAENSDYLDDGSIDEDDDIIVVDERDSQGSEDYETYEV